MQELAICDGLDADDPLLEPLQDILGLPRQTVAGRQPAQTGGSTKTPVLTLLTSHRLRSGEDPAWT